LVSGLWKHDWWPICFTLVIDDFGIKYAGREHALYLKTALESYYPISTNWTGNQYIGITLDWDYTNHKVHLSMYGYIAKALKQFQHKFPHDPQHTPSLSTPIKYGVRKQYTTMESTAPLLNKKARNSSNKCVENFFSSDKPLTPPYFAQSTQ